MLADVIKLLKTHHNDLLIKSANKTKATRNIINHNTNCGHPQGYQRNGPFQRLTVSTQTNQRNGPFQYLILLQASSHSDQSQHVLFSHQSEPTFQSSETNNRRATGGVNSVAKMGIGEGSVGFGGET
jgi:hypothetical protein